MLFFKNEIDNYIKQISDIKVRSLLEGEKLNNYLSKFTNFEDELEICKTFICCKKYDPKLFITFFDEMGIYLSTLKELNKGPFCQLRLANRRMMPKPLFSVPFEHWSDIYDKYVSYLKVQENFVDIVDREEFKNIQNEMSNRIKELSNEYEQLYYYLMDPMAHS